MTPRRTRVVLVLATSAGGTGVHVRALAAGLTGRGVEVIVCGPRSTEELFGFSRTGARFGPVGIVDGLRPYADLRAALALRRHLPGADLVHAHGLRAALVADLARPATMPYVVTWHNAIPTPAGARSLLATAGQRWVARRADVTLCVSPDLEVLVRALGGRDVRPGPVAAAPLPAPARTPAEVRAELGAGDRPLVLSIGRLHQQKGYPTVIEAAARLAARRPMPLCVIAGDGPQRAELAAHIRRTGAPVELLGRRDDVADLLAAADVVVSASGWEGSPLAVQEALRAGRPLVATAVGGVPSLVGAGALLVRPGDPEALAGAVAGVLDDPALAAGLAAAAAVATGDLPTEDSTLRRVAAVYAELLGRTAMARTSRETQE